MLACRARDRVALDREVLLPLLARHRPVRGITGERTAPMTSLDNLGVGRAPSRGTSCGEGAATTGSTVGAGRDRVARR
jgi:hypothetical protein